jgi:hypothetical protein
MITQSHACSWMPPKKVQVGINGFSSSIGAAD